jgi:hypothetical protein
VYVYVIDVYMVSNTVQLISTREEERKIPENKIVALDLGGCLAVSSC